MNERMNRQSTGTNEPICAHWMARPGAQKWVGKDGWVSHGKPETLPGAVKVKDLGAGQGARYRRRSLQHVIPTSVSPQG